MEWFLGKHISNWLFDRKCCSGVCSIFSSILKIYPERITFMFLDTFQIKHEQTRIEKKNHFWLNHNAWRDIENISDIISYPKHIFLFVGHVFGHRTFLWIFLRGFSSGLIYRELPRLLSYIRYINPVDSGLNNHNDRKPYLRPVIFEYGNVGDFHSGHLARPY